MNILIRGGGDIATGVALRAKRAGYQVAITELPQPLVVRRTVSLAEAVYEKQWTVEGITAQRVDDETQFPACFQQDEIPVLIAPELDNIKWDYQVVVDARLVKSRVSYQLSPHPLIIGLGPGFTAGENCHAVVETNRGHTLGRVYWKGSALADTATPEGNPHRVLRAPGDGVFTEAARIGQHVEPGDTVAQVDQWLIRSPMSGVLRGLLRSGLRVQKGLKIGDIDPRDDPSLCRLVSDKALAVGGGVLEAILSWQK
jgi:xanthine dehydrogenase accessory factor